MRQSLRPLRHFVVVLSLLLFTHAARAQSQPTGLSVYLAENSSNASFPFTFIWTWTDNSNGADSVEIDYRIGTTGNFSMLANVAPNSGGIAELQTGTLSPGTVIQFQLRDFQGSSFSQPSNTFQITVPPYSFAAPSNLHATTVNDGVVSLTWSDGNSGEIGVELWVQPPGGAAFKATDVFFYQNKTANITGLVPNTSYTFGVRAFQFNTAGARVYTSFAPTSNPVSTQALIAPTNLQVLTPSITTTPGYTGTALILSWADNSASETGYEVMQRPTGSGAFTVVKVLPAGTTSTNLSQLPPGTSLDFAIQAVYAPSTSTTVTSGLSNVVTKVTTDAITSLHYANAVMGQPFSYTITTSSGQPVQTLNVTNLPAGLNWDGNVTISGTPTTPGVVQTNLTASFTGGWNDNPTLAIRVLSPPTVATAITSQTVTVGGTAASIPLGSAFSDPEESSAVQVSTSLGNMNFILSDSAAPQTVANFRNYISNSNYVGNLFHRSIGDFVIQGGAFKLGAAPNNFTALPTFAPVLNEYTGVSNTVGTVALAQASGNINSGTNQFFINLDNNGQGSQNLDAGKFVVFGRVAGNGLQVANAISSLPTGSYRILTAFPINGCKTTQGSTSVTVPDATNVVAGESVAGAGIPAGATVTGVSGNTVTISSAATASNNSTTLVFTAPQTLPDWPLLAANAPPVMNNALVASINSVTSVGVFSYSASSDATGTATASISNGNVVVTGLAPGSANITVTATDLDGNAVSQTFQVTVNPSNDAALSGLAVNAGALTPAFNSGTTTYAVTVPAGTTSISVTPTVHQAQATVTVNATPVSSGQASSAISLPANATTPITVMVTAQDGTTQNTYTINVTRPLATTLAATSVSSGFATVNASVNPNGSNTTVYFQYGTTAGYGSLTPTLGVGSGTTAVPVGINLAGLAKGTTYHYRVVINSGGTLYFGADQTLTTPATTSPPAWHSTLLTSLGGPGTGGLAMDGARTGASDNSRPLYFYKNTDSNIACAYLTSQWSTFLLSNDNNVSDWLAYGTNYNLCCYQGKDGKLWCVYLGNQWTTVQLGNPPVGVTVAGDVVIDNGWNIIYYRGSDNKVYAVQWNGSLWTHTGLGGAANVKGALAVDNTNHIIYYQGTDNHVWCEQWTGTAWQQVLLGSSFANVGGSLAVDSRGLTVYYRSSVDNSGWLDYWTGTQWSQQQLSSSANMLSTAGLASMMAPYPVAFDTLYLDNNGQCRALYWSGSAWVNPLLGDGASGLTGGLSLHPVYHWAFALRSDGNIVLLYYQ